MGSIKKTAWHRIIERCHMTNDGLNPSTLPEDRKSQLDKVLNLLTSERPSDVWSGMDQVRRWLTEDPEDREIYGLLLDAVQKNNNLKEQVRKLLVEIKEKGSKLAEDAESMLLTPQDFLADADDAYYATDYSRAMQLYRQVLRLDSQNAQAKDRLEMANSLASQVLNNPAAEYYNKAKNFVAERNFLEAANMLREAIARKNDYLEANQLLKDVQNSLNAENLKTKANDALEKERWKDALDSFTQAVANDPTDEKTQLLLLQLRKILKAQNSTKQLLAGTLSTIRRLKVIPEIRETIEDTKEATALRKLWQEIVQDFGDYNKNNIRIQNLILVVLLYILISLMSLWYLYLFPRNHLIVQCNSIVPGLKMTLSYPAYLANGDRDKLDITLTNGSNLVMSGFLLVDFKGTANVQLVNPTTTNSIEYENLSPGEQKSETINFSISEPLEIISDPSQYINFNILVAGIKNSCIPENLHIAMAPIAHLRSAWTWLISGSGIVTLITAFLWEEFINLFSRKKDK